MRVAFHLSHAASRIMHTSAFRGAWELSGTHDISSLPLLESISHH